MNEKYHFGLEVAFRQGVYDFRIVKKSSGELVAIKGDTLIDNYDVFGEEGIMETSRDILSSIMEMVNKRTASNERSLFEKFLKKWGFLHGGEEQSFDQFWEEINNIALLLRRHGQLISKNLDELKQWIIIEELKAPDPIKGYIRINPNTISLEEGYKTRIYYKAHDWDNEFSQLKLEVEADLEAIVGDPIPYYQYYGFLYVISQLEPKVILSPRFNNVSVRQNTRGSGFDEMTTRPVMVPQDLAVAIYTMLLALVTKKQAVCHGCWRPFHPSRPNNLYCSPTCRNTSKQKRSRDRVLTERDLKD